MGPICCTETSFRNYRSTLRKFPCRFHLYRDGSLTSRLLQPCRCVLRCKPKRRDFRLPPRSCWNCALLWVITQRVVVISYRRFRTTYRSHPRGSRIKISWFLNHEHGTDGLCWNSLCNNPEERSSQRTKICKGTLQTQLEGCNKSLGIRRRGQLL